MDARLRLLLDTRALIWWLAGDETLSRRARDAIADADNAVYVSAASAIEVATKFRIGKLAGEADVRTPPHAGRDRQWRARARPRR